jgi:transposase
MAWRRGQAYGQDLRERVLGAWELSLRAAAARFAVSPSYVAKARARLRGTGEATPGPQHNHVPSRLAALADALRARVASGSDATLAELRAWVLAEHGVRVSQPVMWKTLARLGLALKKTRSAKLAGDLRWKGGASTGPGGAEWPGDRRGGDRSGSVCWPRCGRAARVAAATCDCATRTAATW